MKKQILLVFNIIFMTVSAFCQTLSGQLSDCKATLKDGTLTLENNRLSRSYNWNNGDIQSTALTDKSTGYKWFLAGTRADSYFPGAGNPANGSFKVEKVLANSISPAFLKAEVYVKLGTLEVKRVFRIYENCPAIACDYYLRGNVTGKWSNEMVNNGELHNIETNDDQTTRGEKVPVMETLALPGTHWNLHTVKFFDITDRNNTLVQEHEQLIYRAESRMAGNLLFADELLSDQGLFILKEAPTSDVQLAYPGFDFRARTGSLEAVGFGVSPGDLSPDKWTRCYGIVAGVTSGGALGRLQALRSYQEKVRVHLPGRDEMIMMNTWGDRSQDKHIGEAFTIKELNAAHRLHITHFQVDDGWQSGRSSNSAFKGGTLNNIWDNPNYWKPDPIKFSNGLAPLVDLGKKLGIEICLWFNPSKDGSYVHWKNDAEALISLYKTYGIRTFKIDGVQIIDKKEK
ncbi:hypothetical protein [Mucilaginibacter sp.]|uniref:hypothetical protein n=1 Tax=Mucilaginibacter sp. TaxID=1882438 RepID=UPI0032679741